MASPDPEIVSWVEATLGGTASGWRRPSSGGSREAYFVDVARPDGTIVESLLRLEAGGSFTGTDINVGKEAVFYRALGAAGVRVPEVYGLAPDGSALLLERVAGTGDLGETPEEHHRTLVDFMDVLADMHRLDPRDLDLPGVPLPSDIGDHARLDLQSWADLADRRVEQLDPLARYAAAWLLAHPPDTVARTCVVQGDTGPGNFVADGGRVTGLCDFEFAHIGDPMDDIAWLLSRAFDDDPGVAGPYLDRYVARSGIPIDLDSVAYYTIAVQYRCIVTTSLAVTRGGGARGWPPYLMVTQQYLRRLAHALSRRLEVTEPPPAPPGDAGPSARTSWYDALQASLRTAARNIDDPDIAADTRNHQILVHYLRAYDRVGRAVDDANASDLSRVLGVDHEGPELDARVAEAGATADTDALRCLLRRQHRVNLLWASLLDRPARSD